MTPESCKRRQTDTCNLAPIMSFREQPLRRRHFVIVFRRTSAATPITVLGQQRSAMPVIGILGGTTAGSSPSGMTIRMSLAFPLVGLLLLGPALMGCGESGPQNSDTSPPTVIVAKPKLRALVDLDEYTGRFIPVDMVEIMVKQGDLLFTMDKRSFQNALDQAGANLASAKANLAYAEEELATSAAQLRESKIPEQVYTQRLMAKRTAEATVQAARRPCAKRPSTLPPRSCALR
jgi:hypothetical protein